jgi:Ni/Co efflux regulator RcnB
MGYRWVFIDHDAYLVSRDTGLIAEVVRAVLG